MLFYSSELFFALVVAFWSLTKWDKIADVCLVINFLTQKHMHHQKRPNWKSAVDGPEVINGDFFYLARTHLPVPQPFVDILLSWKQAVPGNSTHQCNQFHVLEECSPFWPIKHHFTHVVSSCLASLLTLSLVFQSEIRLAHRNVKTTGNVLRN